MNALPYKERWTETAENINENQHPISDKMKTHSKRPKHDKTRPISTAAETSPQNDVTGRKFLANSDIYAPKVNTAHAVRT